MRIPRNESACSTRTLARKPSRLSCGAAAHRNDPARVPLFAGQSISASFSSIFSIHQIHTFAPSSVGAGASVALWYLRWQVCWKCCRKKGRWPRPGGRIASNPGAAMKGKVYLMGAGSGDPDLLSAQAVRVLRAAEVVLHDDLVSPEILEFVPASAQVRNVHKLALQAGTLQEKIHSLLISAAPHGHSVVRLKSSDAVSTAQADDEAEALAQAGVDFEVIPQAASAVGAAAGANSR